MYFKSRFYRRNEIKKNRKLLYKLILIKKSFIIKN